MVRGTENRFLDLCSQGSRFELLHTVIKSVPLFMGFPWIIKWVSSTPHVLFRYAKIDGKQDRGLDSRFCYSMG